MLNVLCPPDFWAASPGNPGKRTATIYAVNAQGEEQQGDCLRERSRVSSQVVWYDRAVCRPGGADAFPVALVSECELRNMAVRYRSSQGGHDTAGAAGAGEQTVPLWQLVSHWGRLCQGQIWAKNAESTIAIVIVVGIGGRSGSRHGAGYR